MSAFEFLSLATDVLAVVIAISAVIYANARSRERAHKEDVSRLYDMIIEHGHRVADLRERFHQVPSEHTVRGLTQELSTQTAELKLMIERLGGFKGSIERLDRIAETLQDSKRGRSL